MKGKLYLIPTFLDIDSLEVIPKSTADKAIQLKYIIAENIRTTRRYLKQLDKSVDIDAITFFEFNKKTEGKDIEGFFKPLLAGHDVGVFSEAGCPGIADPGQHLIKMAHYRNIQVVPMTGPSSIFLALMASGMNGQNFRFHGYIPIEENKKKKYLQYMEGEAKQRGETQIFMETPFRNNKMIGTILKTLDDKTSLCLAANITGEQESIKTKTIAEWKKEVYDYHKQPCIFLIL
ncbi:MAG: SAM-dependent methyltransferase [Chitinophagales bacterium]